MTSTLVVANVLSISTHSEYLCYEKDSKVEE
jgi:hypothetical protein